MAILAVLVSHYQAVFLAGKHNNPAWLNAGQHGVQLFFVLSGYLITSQLLAEERIHLGRFYTRRFFRLMPAAWTFLAFLALLTAFTPMKVLGRDVWACLLFYRNYVPETATSTCTEHFWSLSLEEQFYLVWPPLLALLGKKRSCILLMVSVAVIALHRILYWSELSQGLLFQRTEVRADAILAGCLMAFALRQEPVRAWFRHHGRLIFFACVPLLIVDVSIYHTLIPLHETLLIGAVLAATSLNPQMLFSRLLDMQNVRITGVLSYGIYLWQGVFLRPAWGLWWALLLPLAFLSSRLLVELPAIRLGRYLTAGRNTQKTAMPCA